MEDKILKKDDGIQEIVKTELSNSESINSTNNMPSEDISLPEENNIVVEEESPKEITEVVENKEVINSQTNSSEDNTSSLDMPSIKENIANNSNTVITNEDQVLSSISSSESTENISNNITPNHQSLAPTDFSAIFNVESEENINSQNNQNANIELPKVEVKEKEEETIVTEKESENSKKANPEMFNSEERLLYEIKPDKEGNPLVVVLFFCLLFSTIVALPYISKKIELEGGGNPVAPNTEEGEEDDKYYFNRSSVRAKLGDLEFTNFVKSKKGNEFKLTFNITNTAERPYLFDKKYYVIMYDEERIIYRALIHSYDAIGSNAASEVTLTISERGYTSANKFKLEEISTARYPEVTLIESEGDNKVMTCTYLNDELKYYFLEDKLVKLKETYHETLESNTNFSSDLRAFNTLSNEYKKIENFNSTFIETSTYFTMINEFDYKSIPDATLSSLKQYKFFRYNETKDVVSFELQAQGYKCS